MRIGVIDSGIGGLTTLRCLKDGINAEYYYFMDRENVPYGDKSVNFLQNRGDEIVNYLLRYHVDIIVIACNTLSAVAKAKLRAKFSLPIVCIEPNIRQATCHGKRTVILATPNTISSKSFTTLQQSCPPSNAIACKDLATLIEHGDIKRAKSRVKAYLAGGIYDNVVLGCTHFVYLKDYISSLGYRVFEGNDGVKRRVESIAKALNISHDNMCKIYLHVDGVTDVGGVTSYLHEPVYFY